MVVYVLLAVASRLKVVHRTKSVVLPPSQFLRVMGLGWGGTGAGYWEGAGSASLHQSQRSGKAVQCCSISRAATCQGTSVRAVEAKPACYRSAAGRARAGTCMLVAALR